MHLTFYSFVKNQCIVAFMYTFDFVSLEDNRKWLLNNNIDVHWDSPSHRKTWNSFYYEILPDKRNVHCDWIA